MQSSFSRRNSHGGRGARSNPNDHQGRRREKTPPSQQARAGGKRKKKPAVLGDITDALKAIGAEVNCDAQEETIVAKNGGGTLRLVVMEYPGIVTFYREDELEVAIENFIPPHFRAAVREISKSHLLPFARTRKNKPLCRIGGRFYKIESDVEPPPTPFLYHTDADIASP